ncbi:MAG: TraG/TraD/VirD4 family protein, partial [Bifidobacterium crudilactis]|nr:TraG/TraD/VirD4 family protein [Bifidobacterium crudilactis]
AAFGATSFNSLFDNANVTVYLGGIKDTKFLGSISQLVGQREVVRSNVQTDHRGARSVSRSVQSEEILPVSRLAEWPVGRALVLASQARAQVVRTMPWNRDPKGAQYDRSAKRQEAQA